MKAHEKTHTKEIIRLFQTSHIRIKSMTIQVQLIVELMIYLVQFQIFPNLISFFNSSTSQERVEPIRLGPQKYGCPFCTKSMQNGCMMKLHIRTHTGEQPFECETCGKTFSQKGSRDRHNLIHTGEKPFECDDCGKRFSRNEHLERHNKLVHRKTI